MEELLTFATGKDAEGHPLFTVKDLSRILGKRRVDCKAANKAYSLRAPQRTFSTAKYVIYHLHFTESFTDRILIHCSTSTIPTIFGGRADDVKVMFTEERIPDGWESRVRKPYGLTILTLNWTVLPMELGVRESDWAVPVDANQAVGTADQAAEAT